jgi:FemAB-related protein (PEP-CTERM system-associated)
VLPLIDFRMPLGRGKLVSLPFCDVGGVLAEDAEAADLLLDAAASVARKIKSRFLELRCGRSGGADTALADQQAAKVRMVLNLPTGAEELLAGFRAKLRSQIKKPLRDGLTACIGGSELLEDFYKIFCENMRDLGSPVHSKRWIKSVVAAYGDRARLGLVHAPDGSPAAGGIVLLQRSTVSIPWASALRRYNSFNPNMLLYWTFLAFAADNGYARFDFGRSTPGEGTFKFKEQWGAHPEPLCWLIFTPDGRLRPAGDLEGTPSKNRRRAEAVWRRLPLVLTNLVGPVMRGHVAL